MSWTPDYSSLNRLHLLTSYVCLSAPVVTCDSRDVGERDGSSGRPGDQRRMPSPAESRAAVHVCGGSVRLPVVRVRGVCVRQRAAGALWVGSAGGREREMATGRLLPAHTTKPMDTRETLRPLQRVFSARAAVQQSHDCLIAHTCKYTHSHTD